MQIAIYIGKLLTVKLKTDFVNGKIADLALRVTLIRINYSND